MKHEANAGASPPRAKFGTAAQKKRTVAIFLSLSPSKALMAATAPGSQVFQWEPPRT
jgi:hypothetical protein